MIKAGDFDLRFTWKKATISPDSTGGNPKTYADNGSLWGAITYDSASEQDAFGAIRESISATIRFRGYPDLSAKDRLYLIQYDELYSIEGVRKGSDFETIVNVRLLKGIS